MWTPEILAFGRQPFARGWRRTFVFAGRNRQFREMIDGLERGIAVAEESMDND